MKNLNKKYFQTFKIIITLITAYYLYNNININLFLNIKNFYFVSLILIPIMIFKIYINSLKISYLSKIVTKNKISLKKIFKILLTAEVSNILPASFLASKIWIDVNLIRSLKLNYKQYILMNIYIIFLSFLIIATLYFFNKEIFEKKYLVGIFFTIIIVIALIFPIIKNYIFYGILFITNSIINILISFTVIYFIDPILINENFTNIFISTFISNYLNLISVLPLNIGYAQMTYGITFELFSLSKDLGVTIVTIKQTSQILIICFIALFILKSFKINKIFEKNK